MLETIFDIHSEKQFYQKQKCNVRDRKQRV